MPRRRQKFSFFPLLKLPILAIEKVLENMDVESLLDFSLTSPKCQKMVRRIRTKEALRMEIWITSNQKSISIFTCPSECRCVRPSVFWDNNANRATAEYEANGNDLKLDGVKMRFLKSPNGFYHLRKNIKEVRQFGALLSHFIETFPRCQIDKLYVFNDNVRPLLTVIGRLRQCKELQLEGNQEVKNDDFRQLLTQINVTKKFAMNLRPNDSFRCDEKRFNCEEISIHQSHWLTRNHLLTMKCARAQLYNAKFSDQDLVDFVKRWNDSDASDTAFEQMEIQMRRGRHPLELDSLEPKKWDRAKHGQYFRLSQDTRLDCSAGSDIERTSDGMIATVITKFNRFYFVVWHNKFPETGDCHFTFP